MWMQIKTTTTKIKIKTKTKHFKLSLVLLLGLDMEKVWLLIPALIFRIAIHVPLLQRSGKRGVSKVKAPLACAFFTHTATGKEPDPWPY